MKFVILFLVLQLYPYLLRAHCDIIEEHRLPSGVCDGIYVIDYIEVGPMEHLFVCVEIDSIGRCKKFEYVGCVQRIIYYYRCERYPIGKPPKWDLNYWQNKFNLINEIKIGSSRINIENLKKIQVSKNNPPSVDQINSKFKKPNSKRIHFLLCFGSPPTESGFYFNIIEGNLRF